MRNKYISKQEFCILAILTAIVVVVIQIRWEVFPDSYRALLGIALLLYLLIAFSYIVLKGLARKVIRLVMN